MATLKINPNQVIWNEAAAFTNHTLNIPPEWFIDNPVVTTKPVLQPTNPNVQDAVINGGTTIHTTQGDVTWEEIAQHVPKAQKDHWENLKLKYGKLFKPEKELTEEEMKKLIEQKLSDIFTYPPLVKYEGLKGKIPVRAGFTHIGVELELEKVHYKNTPPSPWSMHDDFSLKDNGKEFVTKPIKAMYLEVELDKLFGNLKSYHSSVRCSTHVHVNVRDMTLSELYKFICLYLIFERVLYRISGNRWDNNFCVPLYFYTNYTRDFLHALLKGKINHGWKKYYGFNLSPIFGGESTRIGTAEFRHMNGYTTKENLIRWVNIIISLKVSAKKYSLEDLQTIIKDANSTSAYFELAKLIFKDSYTDIVALPTFKEDVEKCITRAKYTMFPKTEENICDIEIDY